MDDKIRRAKDVFKQRSYLSCDLIIRLHRMNIWTRLAAEPRPSLGTTLHHKQVPTCGAEEHGTLPLRPNYVD